MTCCAVRWSYFGKANPSGTLNFFNRLRQGNLSSSRMGLARAGSQLYLFENQFGVYSSPSQRCQKYNFLVLKSSLSNFRTNPIGMDQLKLISNDVRIWLSINTKQCDMNKMHICPLNAIRSIFLKHSYLAVLEKCNYWKRNWQDLKDWSSVPGPSDGFGNCSHSN